MRGPGRAPGSGTIAGNNVMIITPAGPSGWPPGGDSADEGAGGQTDRDYGDGPMPGNR